MGSISHQQAHRWIQSGAQDPETVDQREALERHLEICPDCQAYARRYAEVRGRQVEQVETDLRRVLRARVDEMSARSMPDPRVLSARRRASIMKNQIFRFAGAALAVVLFAVLLVGLARLTPQPAIGDQITGPQVSTATEGAQIVLPTSTPEDVPPAFQGRILYSEAGDLFLTDEQGGRPLNLTYSPEAEGQFAWSPDGEWIAFLREGEAAGLYVMDAEGGRVTLLAASQGQEWEAPAWSPDGKWISMLGREEGAEPARLYLTPLDGAGAGVVDGTRGAIRAQWSPDGNALAYAAPTENGLWGMHARLTQSNWTGTVDLTFRETGSNEKFSAGRDGLFAWSPQSQLAYLMEGPYQDNGANLELAQEASARLVYKDDLWGSTYKVLIDSLPVGQVNGLSWSPDGKTIALVLGDPTSGCQQLSLYRAEDPVGSETVPLCVIDENVVGWSKDGSWLLVKAREPESDHRFAFFAVAASWTMDHPGQAFFTRLGSLSEPALFSGLQPGGASLSIQPGAAQVVVPTSRPAQVQPGEAGGQIYFSASVEDQTELFKVKPDGSETQRLTDSPENEFNLAVSPDGSRVSFLVNQPGVPHTLWSIASDGSDRRQLLGQDFPTSFNMGEGEAANVTPEPWAPIFPVLGRASWSPDGQWLAVKVSPGVAEDTLAIVNADGSGALPGHPGAHYSTPGGMISANDCNSPAWSPDGKWLTFTLGEIQAADLYLAAPDDLTESGPGQDTGALKNLTQTQEWSENSCLAWSPDSQWIAYFAQSLDPTLGSEIHIISVEGGKARSVAAYPQEDGLTPYLRELSWSPDGAYLSVITRYDTGSLLSKTQLQVIDVERGTVTVLVDTGEWIGVTAWSPDGRWLAYSAEVGLWVVEVSGQSEPVQIGDFGDIWSIDWVK